MSTLAHWRAVIAEVNQAGGCAHPVRLRGITLDPSTGELSEGVFVVACKDRRSAVCPSCSRLYKADAWQLIAAGIRGGKGIGPDVAGHPQLFVTLTAPSFGSVHSRSRIPKDTRPCRPRRNAGSCVHGVPASCLARHGEDDPLLGEPLCPGCFDYVGAVLWNAHVPRLWERTSLELYREVARAGHMSAGELRRTVRLSYMKVVEFQRRGLVHLHLVLRADGAGGPTDAPPAWLGTEALRRAVTAVVARAAVSVPPTAGTTLRRAGWGSEHDTRVIVPGDDGDATAIAAYVAKYATKTADGTAWLAHPIRSSAQLARLELRPHMVALVQAAWALGQRKDLAPLHLRAHAHTLGYTGQFSSKSLRFSTTFGALRAARLLYVKGEGDRAFDYDGEWHYAGRGYRTPEAAEVAATLQQALVCAPEILPTPSTSTATPSSTRP